MKTNKKEVEAPAVDETVDAPAEEVKEEEVQEQLKGMIADAVAEVKAKTEKSMEEWKADFIAKQKELQEKRAGIYANEVAEKTSRDARNANLRKMLKALSVRDNATLKDLTEGTDSAGGYVVDTELRADIEHLTTEYGVARREMNFVSMSTPTMNLNNLATDISVAWTAETVAKTSSVPAFGQVSLTAKKIAVIVPMSDELLEDSAFDLLAFLTERIAEKMAEKEDVAFFSGDGTATYGSFTGVLESSSVNTVTISGTSITSIDQDDLLDMVDATPQGALKNGKFYMHRSIMSLVRKLKDSNGLPIYQAPSVSGPATIWGYPVVLVEAMPSTSDDAVDTAFIVFGDLKKGAWFGQRGSFSVAQSNQATVASTGTGDLNLWEQDMTALRVVERVGYALVVPTALTKLVTAAS